MKGQPLTRALLLAAAFKPMWQGLALLAPSVCSAPPSLPHTS